MTETVDNVFRDNSTPGIPASGEHEPEKPAIRSLLRRIEMSVGAGLVVRDTKAQLLLVTPPSANTGGWVLDDPDPTLNGTYVVSAGAWTRSRGFYDTFAKFTNVGGTGDVITADAESFVDPSTVVVWYFQPINTNTGPTLFNGDDLLDVAGNALTAGAVTAGRLLMLVRVGSDWRLLSDPDADGAAAAAAASAADAEADRILAEQAAIDAQAAVTYDRVAVKFTTIAAGPYDMGVGNTIGSPNNLDVKIGGVIQDHDTYTVLGTTFTFTANPGAGLAMEAVLQSETRELNMPAQGSVNFSVLDADLQGRFDKIIRAQDYGAVFDDSVDDRARIKEAALEAAARGTPFLVPNIGLDRATGLDLQAPEDFETIQEAHDATLNWFFPGARPYFSDTQQNHIPQIAMTISPSSGEHVLNGTNITWNHPAGDLIRVKGRGKATLTLASQQALSYSSGVHFIRLRFSTWPATDPIVGRAMRVILPAGSGEAQSFDGVWRITAVDAGNKDITLAVYAKTDTSVLTAIISSGIFIYLPSQARAINQEESGADVGAIDVHTTLRLSDMVISGNASGTNALTTNGIIGREGSRVLLDQHVGVLEFQRSGLWMLNDAYAQVGYAAFCGNNSGINNLQSVIDGTNASVQGNETYGYIGGIGSSGSIVITGFGGCGTAGIVVNGNASLIASGHSRRSPIGVLAWPGGFVNINDMNVRANTVKDVKRHGGGRVLLTTNDVGTFEPALDTGDDFGGFTALASTLAAVV